MSNRSAHDGQPPAGVSSVDPSRPLQQALAQAADDPALSPALRGLLRQAAAELVQARREVDAGHTRYRALFDAVPDPVSVLSREGTVLDLNKAGMAAYKRPREDIIGQPIEVLNPDLPQDHMGPVLEALDRGETYVIEVTNMRADGTRFPVEVHSANLLYDGEDAIVAVARDLSARHEAEVRYQNLIEGIDKAITLQDRDGRVHYMNPAAMRIYGLDREATHVAAPDWSDWLVVDADGRPLAIDAQPPARALDTGKVIASQTVGLLRRSTRQLLWLIVTAVPQFRPGADRAEMVLTLASDITALQRDKVLFDRVQTLARVGAWQWDRASGVLHMSAEARRILGMPGATGTGIRDLLAGICDSDRPEVFAALNAMSDGTGFELTVRGHGSTGAARWMRIIGEPDPHDPGNDRLSGTLQDITERRRAEDDLRVQAQTDALTGLMNRDAILSRIAARLDNPASGRVALLYIDLDRFKIVNDVLGHHGGDALLIEAARRIRRAIGGEGLIARFGGDEFVVACNAADDADRPVQLAERIQHAFADSFRLGDNEFGVSASIGIALADDDASAEQLIQRADVAMYDSKRRARAGFQLFSPELAARQHERLQTETQLRHALDNREFRLVFQPQVDLRSGRVLYAEALVRWCNPLLGEMRPDRFIELAETTGDIVRIGHWVLQEACRQMRRWRDRGLPVRRIAVNVSYRQIIGEDLGERVRQVLAETGLPGEMLELELTERVLVEDASDTRITFDKLRALGVQLSIDDFGEGYSALNYLRRLPIQTLKLSPGFLRGVPDEPSDVAICQAVVGIARSLGLNIVAEGVESEAQRRFLLGHGITLGQGFLFAPGLAPDDFAGMLLAQQAAACEEHE